MSVRRRCLLILAGSALVVMPTLSIATSAPVVAAVAGNAGYCPTDEGVTVVVDFNELGGGIVVRCAPGPVQPGYTGIDALQAAGFSPEGVRRWGLAFVCRLAGRPTADQTLPIDGNPSYHEQCLDTPPLLAYWSYWSAPDGGDWAYNTTGPLSRDAIKGGFEGWSFSLNHQPGDVPAPALQPKRPEEPPTSPPPTSPPPTHSPPTHSPPTHGPPTHTPPTHGPPTHTPAQHQPPTTPVHSAPSASGSGAGGGSPTLPVTTSAPSGTTAPTGGHSTAGPAATEGAAQTGDPSDPVAVGHNGAGDKVSGRLPAQSAASGGSAGPAAIGLIVVGGLGAGAAITAWRRKANRA